MRIGYARVSSESQNLGNQLNRLEGDGCEEIYCEKYSAAAATNRKKLNEALRFVRKGDALVVTKLDRLARSATDLGNIATQLQEQEVDLVVLDQAIDTGTPTGKLMFTMIGAFAEFERDLIRERCQEGIQKAKERGVKFGRPSKLSDEQLVALKEEFAASNSSKAELAFKYGISRASLYRLVAN